MGIQHQRGAAAERSAAKLLGGRRVGNTGKATADVETDWCVCEVKSRTTLPAWLKHAVLQAEAAASRTVSPRLPLVQLHEVGGRVKDDLIVLRAGDFKAWYGDFDASERAA